MKTDEQYVAEFDALFEKHLTWNDQQVIDVFKAQNGSLKEDDVVRPFNKWDTKRQPHVIDAESCLNERN